MTTPSPGRAAEWGRGPAIARPVNFDAIDPHRGTLYPRMRTRMLLSVLGLMLLLPASPATANGGANLVGRMFPAPWAVPEPNPPDCPAGNLVGRWFGGGSGVACFDPSHPDPQTHEVPEDQIDDLEDQGMIFEPTGNAVGGWFEPY